MDDSLTALITELPELFLDLVVAFLIVSRNIIGLVTDRAKPGAILTFPFSHTENKMKL